MGWRLLPRWARDRFAPRRATERHSPLAPPQSSLVTVVGSGGAQCGGAAVVVVKVPVSIPVRTPASGTGGPPASAQEKVVVFRPRTTGFVSLKVAGGALVLPFYRPKKLVVIGHGKIAVGSTAQVESFDRISEQRILEDDELLDYWIA